MTITKFVTQYGTYQFPTSPGDQNFTTDFKKMKTKVTKGIGTNGGVDEYGMGASPYDGESIQFSVYLNSNNSRSAMQALRDSLNTMCAWGVGRLVDNINGVERWCYARIGLDDIKEDRAKHTDLFQKVNLTFQTSDPFWNTAGTEGVLWGASTWGGTTWDGTASPTTITTTGTITVTNNGSAFTQPRLVLWNNSGSTISNPTIQRVIAGSTVDLLAYTGSIADGQQLELNPRKHTALLDGTNVISAVSFTHPDWLRLLPGSNTLQVDVTGVVKVYVHQYERYT